MDKTTEQILVNKLSAIKNLTLNGNELTISKSLNIKGDATCNKLTCNSIEIRATGNKTLINDAIITKSTLDSTPIGIKVPASAKLTQVIIESNAAGNKDNAFKLDGDITIFNSDKETRFINCLSNPLNIKTNKYLVLNSQEKLDLFTADTNFITNVFNINTSQITSTGYLHISNTNNSTSLNSGSLIIDGGMAVTKNITLGGSINSLVDTHNNIKGRLNIENNISTSGTIIINNTNNLDALNVNGGVIIRKNTNIYDSLTVYNNLNILNNNNSTNIINGDTIIKNNLTINKNVNILQNLNIFGQILLENNNDSINTETGSLTINGGIGIKKNVNIGGSTNIQGNLSITNTSDSFNINTGSITTNGGMGIAKDLNVGGNTSIIGATYINGNLNILNNEDSINTNSGSLITQGGLVVKKNININGIQHIINNTESRETNNGALIVDGGVGIGKNLNINGSTTMTGNLSLNNTLTVTDKSYFEDDVHLTKDIYLENIHIRGSILRELGNPYDLEIVPSGQYSDLLVRDELIVSGEDQSLDISTGSIVTNGGVGIKKNVNIGEDLNVLGNATFSNNVNCVKTLYADSIFVKYNITSSEGNISGAGGTAGLVGQPDIPFDTLVGNLNISNNLSVSNAFSSIDQWINTNIIDTPPILVSNNPPLVNGEFIQLEFSLPTQIYVGFLNKKLPIIDSLYIDYKKSTDIDYITVNMNSININKIRIYPFNYTNYSENSTFYLFNINKETSYDFRIYAKNNNTNRPVKYLYFNSLQTKSSNLLEPPTNITLINNNNNPSTSIDLNWNHSISPNISIYKYNISYSTLNSIKYPNFVNHNSNSIITSLNIIYNANNFSTINGLYPGHTYNINIQAKNILNNDYGIFSNTNNTILTHYPMPPDYITNKNLYIINNTNYHFNINSGFSLNGLDFIPSIFNYNKLDNHFETNIITDLRINENISTTDTNTTKIISNLNNTENNLNIYNNLNLHGFSHINNSTEFTDKFNIKLSNVDDYYTDIFNNGFYKKTDLQITFNNCTNYLIPSTEKYTLQIQQNLPFSKVNHIASLLDFNIDQLTSFPEISNIHLNLNSITSDSTYYTHISGVPTIINGNINFDFHSKYLTNNYLRNDKKHFNIYLTGNHINFSENNNITSDTIKNTNNFYYNLDNNLHNTDGKIILPNTTDLLFKNQTIKINNIDYIEDLTLNIISYNLHGESHTTYSTKIRLDTESINVKNNINNANSNLGLYVTSGNTQYPENQYVDYGNTFNHSANLLNTSDLQLVNGYFSTPYNINTFLNYTNYFNNSTLNYYNYSTIIANDSFRYITFRYNNLANDINKITIEFIDSNIDELLTPNIQLFVKITNQSNTTFNTAWLDANKPINLIGLNNNTKDINGTGCLSMYRDYTSTSKKKYCYLPNGSTGTLYVKLGLISNKDFLIKYIKVSSGFI